jgi:hypothetical protein
LFVAELLLPHPLSSCPSSKRKNKMWKQKICNRNAKKLLQIKKKQKKVTRIFDQRVLHLPLVPSLLINIKYLL